MTVNKGQQENDESLRIIYYCPCRTGVGRTLYRTIVDEAPGSSVKVCSTMDCFAHSIRETKQGPVMAVVLAANEELLLPVYFNKHRLYSAPMLLVLPDREPETRALGFRIKPDSLCYVDSSSDEIRLALRSIADHLRITGQTMLAKMGTRFDPGMDLTDAMSGNQAA